VRIAQLTVGPFQENCYLLTDEESSTAAIIDPGDESGRIIAALDASGATLEAIWVTHAHLDHIGAIAAIKRKFDVPIFLHPADMPLYRAADRQAAAYGLPFEPPPPPEREFADGDVVRLGDLQFSILHAPGHAPGHVVIHGHGVAFCGDCVFAGSIGRTDLPFSDGRALAVSLQRIALLPPGTILYSGHGPSTTLERELVTNPFLNGRARVVGS
jgi:glyoxylase-like metal-dependent hydrolase (beta-lactamase superfamily II)